MIREKLAPFAQGVFRYLGATLRLGFGNFATAANSAFQPGSVSLKSGSA